MEGWLKIHRRILEWEWYHDGNMLRLFLHLMIKANYMPGRWEGLAVGRGQLLTTVQKLTEQTGLTTKEVRTCLARLEKTGEISKQTANKYTLLTVVNFDKYQIEGGEGANEGQTNGKEEASQGRREGNSKRKKESENIELPLWLPMAEWLGWLEMRVKKRASPTVNAQRLAIKKLEQYREEGYDPAEILRESTLAGWTGLWLSKEMKIRGKKNAADAGKRDYAAGRFKRGN